MKYETQIERQRTFANRWTLRYPAVKDLVQAGLYYPEKPCFIDEVRCYICGVHISNWSPNDKPWEEHRKYSPCCPFIWRVDLNCESNHGIDVVGSTSADGRSTSSDAESTSSDAGSTTAQAGSITDSVDMEEKIYVLAARQMKKELEAEKTLNRHLKRMLLLYNDIIENPFGFDGEPIIIHSQDLIQCNYCNISHIDFC